jgi:acetylornithine deacetylase
MQIDEIRSAVHAVRSDSERFLCELIRQPSLPGGEAGAVDCAAEWFSRVAEVERIPLSDALLQDPDYSNPVAGLHYEGRSNLRVRVAGAGRGQTLLFNTHLDVVPASEGQERPFDPELVNGDLLAHLVVEEEVGGNGTLAMVRRGEQADGCIVMEPTDLRILPSVRGAVWFRVICIGKAGHSGRAGDTVSALKMAIRTIDTLERFHARLLAGSRGIPLFDQFLNPMPITFGKLQAGNWPASAPAQAVIEGVLGLLPNKTRFQVMDEMRQAIVGEADEWTRDHFELQFMYRHDSHVLDPGHALPEGLVKCCQAVGLAGEISAMTASCDSWLYNNTLGIPSVVFGPGSLGVAHSRDEQIRMDDIERASTALLGFATKWCGRN